MTLILELLNISQEVLKGKERKKFKIWIYLTLIRQNLSPKFPMLWMKIPRKKKWLRKVSKNTRNCNKC